MEAFGKPTTGTKTCVRRSNDRFGFKLGKAFACIAFALLCSSCSKTFYQVYEVKSNELEMKNISLVFENDECRVLYNLWSEGGIIRFRL